MKLGCGNFQWGKIKFKSLLRLVGEEFRSPFFDPWNIYMYVCSLIDIGSPHQLWT